MVRPKRNRLVACEPKFTFFKPSGVPLSSLEEVILSVAGWVLILVRHPFCIGDRIEINGVKGDVIDIRLFQTTF